MLSIWGMSTLLFRILTLLLIWLPTWSLNLWLLPLFLLCLSLSLTASKDIGKDIWNPGISWLFLFLANIHYRDLWCFVVAKFLFGLFHGLVELTLRLIIVLCVFLDWRSVSWVDERMENWDLARALGLDEGEEFSFFYFWIYKCLAHIISIFKEVDNAPISINKHTNNWSFWKMSKLWLLIWLYGIIIFPSSFSKNISSCQINAINLFWSRKISFNCETLPGNSNIDFWKMFTLLKCIHSPLEVEYLSHILQGNHRSLYRFSSLQADL